CSGSRFSGAEEISSPCKKAGESIVAPTGSEVAWWQGLGCGSLWAAFLFRLNGQGNGAGFRHEILASYPLYIVGGYLVYVVEGSEELAPLSVCNVGGRHLRRQPAVVVQC